jgi:hypothetical protein
LFGTFTVPYLYFYYKTTNERSARLQLQVLVIRSFGVSLQYSGSRMCISYYELYVPKSVLSYLYLYLYEYEVLFIRTHEDIVIRHTKYEVQVVGTCTSTTHRASTSTGELECCMFCSEKVLLHIVSSFLDVHRNCGFGSYNMYQ